MAMIARMARTPRRTLLAGAGLTASAWPLTLIAGRKTAPARGDLVRAENARPGTTDWMLARVESAPDAQGDERFRRRRAIEGYCSHTSARAGDTVAFFVSAQPASRFSVDFYRMGHYAGAGGRHVLSLPARAAAAQPDPSDGPKNLVEARWKPTFTLKIPHDWLSGVYLGKLTALASGYQAYVVLVVRDDRRADFLFQTSDMTWQAYNRWPAWRSIYDWQGNKWHTTPGADVGFDRPYSLYYNGLPSRWNPLSNGSGEWLLWEHPLAFWMEAQGYDVTYGSNLDTHRDPDHLLRARGFLSVGHDEYWTDAMVRNVTRARDQGVNLAFLSGNAVYHHIYLNSSSDGRAHRVFGRIDKFADEHRLMGATSYGVGLGDFVCRAPDHWLYQGTGMKAGDAIRDLVGWEYHGPGLRDDRDLIVLAQSELSDGKKKAEGGHAATIYPGPKGNFVFNAGTCWWSLPLATPPGFMNPPGKDFSRSDPRVQRMTRNLLERMRAVG
jgi:hypothetical protein